VIYVYYGYSWSRPHTQHSVVGVVLPSLGSTLCHSQNDKL